MSSVSCVITTHNRPTMLREALESVLTQKRPPEEVIVCDSAGSPDTPTVVKPFLQSDSRIVYYRWPRKTDAYTNIPYAFSLASAQYIAWLHDDDAWGPAHLETGLHALCSSPHAVLYCSRAAIFGGHTTEHFVTPSWARGTTSETIIDFRRGFTRWLGGHQLACSSAIFSKHAYSQIRSFWDSKTPTIDWILWGSLALRGPVIYNPAALVRYRWHADNHSRSAFAKRRGVGCSRYALRVLASAGLRNGVLTLEELQDFLREHPDRRQIEQVVLALASIDTPAELRRVALRAAQFLSDLKSPACISGHLRVSSAIGSWYLEIADILDRIIARWWPRVPA